MLASAAKDLTASMACVPAWIVSHLAVSVPIVLTGSAKGRAVQQMAAKAQTAKVAAATMVRCALITILSVY